MNVYICCIKKKTMNFKTRLLQLFILLFSFCVSAQKNDKLLFKINDDAYYTEEFLRVYNKNLDILQDEEQKDINNYLDLFVDYKLKVTEAYALGYDQDPKYKKELKEYRDQLLQPYLVDNTNLDFLVEQAYERSKYEVKASHIMVQIAAEQKDTAAAYAKISEAYDQLVSGKDFKTVAVKYSEDPSVKSNKGDLGYFTVFDMVYPFENAAYDTQVGSFSKIIRTKFGYHIVKVENKIASQGERSLAHIFIRDTTQVGEDKINNVYEQLKNGEDFLYLVRTQSDDKASIPNQGQIGVVRYSKVEENIAKAGFALEKPGDYSKPVKSAYGWHIIKLRTIYPIKPFAEDKERLTRKVKRSDRYGFYNHTVVESLRKKYNISIHEDGLNDFKREGLKDAYIGGSKPLLTIEGSTVTQENLVNFLDGKRLNDDLWEDFLDDEVLEYYKKIIEGTEVEYIAAYKEYKEGLLLFYILEDKIWNKSKDSVGTVQYYNENLDKYTLDERVKGVVVTGKKKRSVKYVRKLFKKGFSLDSIQTLVAQNDKISAVINEGEFDKNNELTPENYELAVGNSKVYKEGKKDEKRYTFIHSEAVLEQEVQELSEVRGAVISDYQTTLEKEWLNELRSKYKVTYNHSVVDSLEELNGSQSETEGEESAE